MEKVYVCSPCRADTKEAVKRNMEDALYYVELLQATKHVKAYAPHAYLPPMLDDNDEVDRDLANKICIDILRECSAIYVFGKVLSEGMRREVIYAAETSKEIIVEKVEVFNLIKALVLEHLLFPSDPKITLLDKPLLVSENTVYVVVCCSDNDASYTWSINECEIASS